KTVICFLLKTVCLVMIGWSVFPMTSLSRIQPGTSCDGLTRMQSPHFKKMLVNEVAHMHGATSLTKLFTLTTFRLGVFRFIINCFIVDFWIYFSCASNGFSILSPYKTYPLCLSTCL